MENTKPRVLGYQLATELSLDELETTSGGARPPTPAGMSTLRVTGNSSSPDLAYDNIF